MTLKHLYYLIRKKLIVDEDLHLIIKLTRVVNERKLEKISISNIRRAYIKSHFSDINSYLKSLIKVQTKIKNNENIDKYEFLDLDTKELDLENWLKIYRDNGSSIRMIHNALTMEINRTISLIIRYGKSGDYDRMSYYKRLTCVYFKDYKNWVDTLKGIL